MHRRTFLKLSAILYNTDGAPASATQEAKIYRMFEQLARAVERESESGMTLRAAIETTTVWAGFSAEERQQVLYAVNTTVEHEFVGGIDELDALNFDDAEA